MKHLFYVSIAIFLAFAQIISGEENCDKIYMHPSHVFLGENGIFVIYEEQALPVYSINYDHEGIYFTPSEIAWELPTPKSWECEVCGHKNWFWKTHCADCGHRHK